MVAVYCRSDNFVWLVPKWVLCLYWIRKNRRESKSRFFVQNRIEIDRLAKISYRHSTTNQRHSAFLIPHFTFRIPQFRILPIAQMQTVVTRQPDTDTYGLPVLTVSGVGDGQMIYTLFVRTQNFSPCSVWLALQKCPNTLVLKILFVIRSTRWRFGVPSVPSCFRDSVTVQAVTQCKWLIVEPPDSQVTFMSTTSIAGVVTSHFAPTSTHLTNSPHVGRCQTSLPFVPYQNFSSCCLFTRVPGTNG